MFPEISEVIWPFTAEHPLKSFKFVGNEDEKVLFIVDGKHACSEFVDETVVAVDPIFGRTS